MPSSPPTPCRGTRRWRRYSGSCRPRRTAFSAASDSCAPFPRESSAQARGLFGTDRETAEDSYLVDTRESVVRVYSDGQRGLTYGAYALLWDARDTGDGKSVRRGLLRDLPRCPFRGLKVYMPAPDDLDSFYRTVDLLLSLRYNTIIIEVGGAMESEINSAWIDYCISYRPGRIDAWGQPV